MKSIKKIICIALAVAMTMGMAVFSFAADMPYIVVYDADTYMDVAYYPLEDKQLVNFTCPDGCVVEIDNMLQTVKLVIDNVDKSPSKATLAQWKKEDPKETKMWYSLGVSEGDTNVAVVYNAKKKKMTVVTADGAAPAANQPSQEELLAQYYAALEKQQKNK